MLARVHRLSRRAALGLIGAMALTACTSTSEDASSSQTAPSSSSDPDAELAARVGAQEWALITAYDQTISAHPELATLLTPLRDQHREHADALGQAQPAVDTPIAPAAGSATQAVADLLAAERVAVAERTTACAESSAAAMAELLALIAASEAGHVEFLRRSAP